MQQDEAVLTELLRMFDTYRQTATASQIDDYMAVLGPCRADDLRDARLDAMRESGAFPPAPGPLRKALDDVRRARPPSNAIAAEAGPSVNEQIVMRELHRRLWERPRGSELKPFREYLAERREVEEQLAADLIALSRRAQ